MFAASPRCARQQSALRRLLELFGERARTQQALRDLRSSERDSISSRSSHDDRMTRPCIQIGRGMQQRDSAMHLDCWPAITALSTFFYTDGAATPTSHVPCAIHANRRKHTQKKTYTERDEMKTKQLLKISAAPAGVFCALAFFSTATPAAAAQVDYYRTDTSGMRCYGYSSL